MPIVYLRHLTGKHRSKKTNTHLACFLAFTAGAVNAGGFLAVHQYTSHMSGIISAMADSLALGETNLLLDGVGALLSFLAGAICSTLLINWSHRHSLHSAYAFPLVLEAVLLICFGLLGEHLARHQWFFIPITVTLLCFIMGLQNAMITKLSKAEIRTTHMTGMITDIGIQLGRLLDWSRTTSTNRYTTPQPDFTKLRLLCSLVGLFFTGGTLGALGFKHIGFISSLALATLLLILAVVPVTDDIRRQWQQLRHPG